MDTLAINGGKKAVKDKLIKGWPPISALDRKMVLASLNEARINDAHGGPASLIAT